LVKYISEKTLVNISHKIFLAPLAGYTDQAFRRLCKSFGVDFLVSEMVSSDGLIRDSHKTFQFISYTEEERPFGVQIFGSDPLTMAKAAGFLLSYQPDFIDINMGCPVKKVIKRGAGSALMKEPEKAASIVREVKQALSGAIPLSVKFRSGWDHNSLNYMDFGLMLQEAGADFLCLHPRTTKQMFSGQSNWDHISNLKQQIAVPLIGNGDITSPEDAQRMYQETGCDAVMIGRGALGKPWIFSQLKEFDLKGDYSALTHQTLFETLFKHLDLALENKREALVVKEIRSQFCFYTKGLVGGAELRNQINHCPDIKTLKELLSSYSNHSIF